jgi:hypothetical protein
MRFILIAIDILHSFAGLASLSILKEPGTLDLDATLGFSVHSRQYLESLPWWNGEEPAE